MSDSSRDTRRFRLGRRYYHPKRKHHRPSGANGLLIALVTAWLGSRGRHGHHAYRKPSLKSSVLGFVLKRVARRFG